ncbi:hypothetical protein E2C01_007141 [Portunus trituberculatus]|uniref:Uncharacterized protein n=1 Tax=Portunus trituberculatus TaxID=210409 RepID=A0A5B7CX21_PORTR|nr:hypothetical protein [Portunus trituberculatus]
MKAAPSGNIDCEAFDRGQLELTRWGGNPIRRTVTYVQHNESRKLLPATTSMPAHCLSVLFMSKFASTGRSAGIRLAQL